MSVHLPALWTLGFSDEVDTSPSVRAQTAVVRTLVHALDQLTPSSDLAGALRQQLAEELARLGSRIEEATAQQRTREQP